MSSLDILSWVVKKASSGEKVALISIIGKEESAPRDMGALMAVSSSGHKVGTIGGGELEEVLVREALSALKENKPRRVKLALRPDNVPEDAVKTGMYCGGVVEVFINIIQPAQRLVLVGAGHVGKPLADIGAILGYSVVVVDKDPNLASPERYPYAERLVDDVVSAIDKLELRESDVVVVAYGEPETDYQVLKRLLQKNFKGHIWVLCSRKRAQWMLDRLRSEGVNIDELRGRVHAPAGLDIGSDTPEEIAVSIWAEVICEMRACNKPVKSLSLLG